MTAFMIFVGVLAVAGGVLCYALIKAAADGEQDYLEYWEDDGK